MYFIPLEQYLSNDQDFMIFLHEGKAYLIFYSFIKFKCFNNNLKTQLLLTDGNKIAFGFNLHKQKRSYCPFNDLIKKYLQILNTLFLFAKSNFYLFRFFNEPNSQFIYFHYFNYIK